MTRTSLAILAGALLLANGAQSASLTNRDAAEYRLHIVDLVVDDSGEPAIQDIMISANESLDGICLDGCTVALNDGNQLDLDGDETVYIENGTFVVDQ